MYFSEVAVSKDTAGMAIRLKEADPIMVIGPNLLGFPSLNASKQTRKRSGAAEVSAKSEVKTLLGVQSGIPDVFLILGAVIYATYDIIRSLTIARPSSK